MTPEDRQAFIDALPVGRFGRPEEIAATALLLAGPDGGFYVGATPWRKSVAEWRRCDVLTPPLTPLAPETLHISFEAGPYRMAMGLVTVPEPEWFEIDTLLPAKTRRTKPPAAAEHHGEVLRRRTGVRTRAR
jgi:hypothetical protein